MTTNNSEVVKFSIYAGSILANDGHGVNIGVKDVIKHDDFYDIDFVKNDIALLKLDNPLPFNQNISKICLPKSYREVRQKMAFMAGFGGFANFMLFDTTIPFQDFNHCKIFNQKWNYTSQNYICSGAYKSGIYQIGSEHGDSGGPLMVQGSNHPRWFVIGAIVSTDYPNWGDWSHMVSTRISFYCDWIEDITDGDAKCIDMDDNNNDIFTKTNAQCGCCFQPNCWCCPQTTTNASVSTLRVCSSTCADTMANCAQYSTLCSSTLYRDVMLANCRCTCGLCTLTTTTIAPITDPCFGKPTGTAIGPCLNGVCQAGALCFGGQCLCAGP